MANPLDSALQRALAIRLNLQISLSQLPVVEEWMDIHLERWLDNVPMPPDMPDGFVANFLVAVGADLERLWWGAYGHPRGFVPKMAEYFRLCGMSKSDEAVLDSIGLTLEPELVGTWVSVRRGRITTGWHFWDEHPWEKIEPLFGDHAAKEVLKAWVAEAGVTRVERFTQAIGQAAGQEERSDVPYSEIEFALPGVALDDQLEALAAAWQRFTGVALPSAVPDAFSGALTPGFGIAVRIAGGGVTKVTAVSPSLGNDVVATLCAATGISYSDKLGKVSSALSAESSERVEFGIHAAGGPPEIDVYVEPTEAPHKPVRSAN